MDFSKVLVFGSFNEEEASLFQKAAEREGLLSFRQSDLQFGSFVCQIESTQSSHEVPSKHPFDSQVTERGHLGLNGNPDSRHGQECFVSNGGRTDQPSRKKQGSSKSQESGCHGALDSAVATTNDDKSSTKVKPRGEAVINENGMKKTVTTNGGDISSAKVKPRGEAVINENGMKKTITTNGGDKSSTKMKLRGEAVINENGMKKTVTTNGGDKSSTKVKPRGEAVINENGMKKTVTTNGGDKSSTKVKPRGEAVINESGMKKTVDSVWSLQESENESSSKFIRDGTIEQLEVLNIEINSSVKEAIENPTSLTEDIPMSWVEKFGQKVGYGQVVRPHGDDKGMAKSGIVSATLKASQCKAYVTSDATGGAEATKRWQPRGLINAGNLCFLNATLQALVSCAPFFQLLQTLKSRDIPEIGYPILQAFTEFVATIEEAKLADPHLKKTEKAVEGLEAGKPFRPSMFDPVLKLFSPDQPLGASGSHRQEDAQEFLSFVMHQMHDELLQLENKNLNGSTSSNSSLVTVSEDDEWETVGPKNRSAVTRTQSLMESNLSVIFGGQLRSVIKSRGNKASATIQPYLLLHLEIISEAVKSVEDALHVYASPESLECYRTSTGKEEVVSARKSVKLQTLSKVLVLHLMRFSYGSTGISKVHKPVRFSPELVIGRELLVSPTKEGRRYELVASISHHGRDPSKGHYTTDSKHSNGQWVRFDDAYVSVVDLNKVLHDQAYILFYKQL